MPIKSRADWEIYAQELVGRKFGHPMWYADPAQRSGPIELGDIGYFDRGRFYLLSNCTRPENDESHNRRGEKLPQPFVQFEYHGDRSTEPAINQEEIRSHRTFDHEGDVHLHGGAPGGGGGEAEIERNRRGTCIASLRLQRPAHRTFLHDIVPIEEYVAEHRSTWVKFFRDKGPSRKKILFVYGYTTTSRWETTAWESKRSKDKFSLGFLFSQVASLGGTIGFAATHSMEKANNSHPDRNRHPSRVPPNPSQADQKADLNSYPPDQCIFLDLYRQTALDAVKHRIKRPFRSGAQHARGLAGTTSTKHSMARSHPRHGPRLSTGGSGHEENEKIGLATLNRVSYDSDASTAVAPFEHIPQPPRKVKRPRGDVVPPRARNNSRNSGGSVVDTHARSESRSRASSAGGHNSGARNDNTHLRAHRPSEYDPDRVGAEGEVPDANANANGGAGAGAEESADKGMADRDDDDGQGERVSVDIEDGHVSVDIVAADPSNSSRKSGTSEADVHAQFGLSNGDAASSTDGNGSEGDDPDADLPVRPDSQDGTGAQGIEADVETASGVPEDGDENGHGGGDENRDDE
ncbi:hypothetical protein C8T65DRAFT_831433 [Cerioporus squamosus]|nr:hypothetical protein C8T65DRAFT_831433 [Cerioporus squamosus]